MNAVTASRFVRPSSALVLLAFSLVLSAALLTGCGGGSQMGEHRLQHSVQFRPRFVNG
jgi:hypothetical protein